MSKARPKNKKCSDCGKNVANKIMSIPALVSVAGMVHSIMSPYSLTENLDIQIPFVGIVNNAYIQSRAPISIVSCALSAAVSKKLLEKLNGTDSAIIKYMNALSIYAGLVLCQILLPIKFDKIAMKKSGIDINKLQTMILIQALNPEKYKDIGTTIKTSPKYLIKLGKTAWKQLVNGDDDAFYRELLKGVHQEMLNETDPLKRTVYDAVLDNISGLSKEFANLVDSATRMIPMGGDENIQKMLTGVSDNLLDTYIISKKQQQNLSINENALPMPNPSGKMTLPDTMEFDQSGMVLWDPDKIPSESRVQGFLDGASSVAESTINGMVNFVQNIGYDEKGTQAEQDKINRIFLDRLVSGAQVQMDQLHRETVAIKGAEDVYSPVLHYLLYIVFVINMIIGMSVRAHRRKNKK